MRSQIEISRGIITPGGAAATRVWQVHALWSGIDAGSRQFRSDDCELDQGGLGLPDSDYYTKEDEKSKQTRARYLEHVQKVFELLGDNAATAKQNAGTVLRLETEMAKASLTRVERRDPYKLKHKMGVSELTSLAPNFDWKAYYKTAALSGLSNAERGCAGFFQGVEQAPEGRAAGQLEDVPAISCGRFGRTLLNQGICRKRISSFTANTCVGRRKSRQDGSAA